MDYDSRDDMYARLGVSSEAKADEIRAAWRRKAREVHPDLNPRNPNATRAAQCVNAAYQILSDPVQRAQYDKARTEYWRRASAELGRILRQRRVRPATPRSTPPPRPPPPSAFVAKAAPPRAPRGPFTILGREVAKRMARDGNWFGAFVAAFGGSALDAYLEHKLR